MRVALTGTPGTGKTTVARLLAAEGAALVDLVALAEDVGAVEGVDAARGARVVDEETLADAFASVAAQLADLPLVLCESHFAHEMPVDLVVVLRAEPGVLAERLHARGWPVAKVRENVEAEAMGVVAWEALTHARAGRYRATEVDASAGPPEAVVDAVRGLLAPPRRRLPPPDPGRYDVGALPWI